MFSFVDLASEGAQDLPRPEEHRETAVSKQLNLQQQLKVSFRKVHSRTKTNYFPHITIDA